MAQTNTRDRREPRLVSKLTDPNNVATPEIAHHRAGLPGSGGESESRIGSEGTAAAPKPSVRNPGSEASSTGSGSRKRKAPTVTEIEDSEDDTAGTNSITQGRQKDSAPTNPSPTAGNTVPLERHVPEDPKSRKKQKTSEPAKAIDPDIQMIDVDEESAPPRHAATRDIEHFFSRPFPKPGDADKSMRNCLKCSSKKTLKSLVSESSTIRRHLAAFHEVPRWHGTICR
ncbi:hypothetical protein OH76DRAFT_1489998 [Lentinus brumalis]|uniref:Uncharacterized protein n=1 Tax=Lentinus brumalis TaxID=2498619 RepID=A0A371CKF8_9APHY|nr:hypothetical protein OH76DRAFT_1489998 [Polyporus brumalis]